MWNFLPWNSTGSFLLNYDSDKEGHVTKFDNVSLWTLCDVKKKQTREQVSLFSFAYKSAPHLEERAKQSLKRIKTLRHPSIIKYIDSCVSDTSVDLIVEPITPLFIYLESEKFKNFTQDQKDFIIAYGLQTVAKGLDFLNNDCKLNHNNINIHSIFVDSAGIFKIGLLEYVCEVGETSIPRYDSLCEKYTPPERLDDTKNKIGHIFSPDSWGFGCLVWEIFNKPITSTSSVRTVGRMPRALGSHYNKLVQTNPRQRISPKTFIEECKSANILFDNPLLESMNKLEEIQFVKESTEISKYFAELENQIDTFPVDMCKFRLLPDLINAFEYGGSDSTILDPIFKIGQILSNEEYQKLIVPHITKFFSCKNRATRSKLLQRLDSYINHLSPPCINDHIFPQIAQGLLDNNYVIREQTIKSMLHLAPKLNSKNLNQDLANNLVQLMIRDSDGLIRTSATVCMGKIAKLLSIQIQQNVFLVYMLKMLSDSVSTARHAAVVALSANRDLFDTKDCATKIMPGLCQVCIDADLTVKALALKALKMFIELIEEDQPIANTKTETVPS